MYRAAVFKNEGLGLLENDNHILCHFRRRRSMYAEHVRHDITATQLQHTLLACSTSALCPFAGPERRLAPQSSIGGINAQSWLAGTGWAKQG